MSLDNKFNIEIIDIEGIKFLDHINKAGGDLDNAAAELRNINNRPDSEKYTEEYKFWIRQYKDAMDLFMSEEYTSRMKNLQVVLIFPPIPPSLKRFSIRELPADKSDWSCNNIKLE